MTRNSWILLFASLCLLSPAALAQGHAHPETVASVPAGERPVPPDTQAARPADGGAGGRLWSQADAIYGADVMAAARAHVLHEMGAMNHSLFRADRLEVQSHDGAERLAWDLKWSYGGDIDRLLLKTEGDLDIATGDVEDVGVEALWSRAVDAFWDVRAGLRYDIEPDGRVYGVVSLHGLAPFLFEVDAAAYLSEKGDLSARLESDYTLRLSQQLLLQPRVELEWAAADSPGARQLTAGLRLRYEIIREAAPYLGLEWVRNLDKDQGGVASSEGGRERLQWVAGLRLWY